MRRLTPMLVLLGAGTLVASSGCADNDSGLFVRAVLALESPECVAQADPTAAILGQGTLDTSFGGRYVAWLLLGNQLVPRGSPNQLRTETSRITIRGAEVSVLNGSTTVAEFTQSATGFADPGSQDEPGYGVSVVTLLPPGLAQPGQRYTVDVRVFGDTLGGDEITSESLTYPIETCNGCTINYPPGSDDPAQGGYQCAPPTEEPEDDALPCFLGQDAIVDCTACQQTGNPLCIAPASSSGP